MKIENIFKYSFAILSLTVMAACSDSDSKEPLPEPVKVESVNVSPATITLTEGETASLKVEILPEDAASTEVIWSTSDPDIATVASDGTVTAVGCGNAVVTAAADGVYGTCSVSVVMAAPKVESVTVNPATITLTEGETASLKVEILPEDAAYTEVIWTTSDPNIATVESDGTVTAVGCGDAVVTATVDDVSGTCTVKVEPSAPKLGDFYYSDGSWSTDIDPSRSIIGVVFWVGDPTATDATLRKAHPDCTHGLVIAFDQEVSAWQPGYESLGSGICGWIAANAAQYELPQSNSGANDPLQKIIGYNNTKAIEAFNAASENAAWPVEAVAKIVAYRDQVPAPAKSSDWYLPSPKELSLLCAGEITGNIYIKDPVMTNITFINDRIDEAGGNQITPHSFWSSTEAYDPAVSIIWSTAWNYCFDNVKRPLSYSFKAWEEYARVRAVLAF